VGPSQRDILATLGRPGRIYLALLVVCFLLMLLGGGCWVYLILTGMGVTHPE